MSFQHPNVEMVYNYNTNGNFRGNITEKYGLIFEKHLYLVVVSTKFAPETIDMLQQPC